jgi:pyruvate formate lyase activating enzyme
MEDKSKRYVKYDFEDANGLEPYSILIYLKQGIRNRYGNIFRFPLFNAALFMLAKKDGLNTMIDSNGTVPFWEYPSLLEVTDGVMLDIKAFKNEDHVRITDEKNEIVLKNAVYLAENKKLYEVRAVIVPDLYDTKMSIRQMGEFLAPYLEIQEFRIKLIAYRPMGVRE